MAISIDTIESALADRGLDTKYTGMDELSSYLITGSHKSIEIIDGVSGDTFRSENVVEAIVYGDDGQGMEDATAAFEDVETVEEFLAAVAGILH